MKRYSKIIFDDLVVLTLLVMIAPLLGAIAAGIKLLSRGPLLVREPLNLLQPDRTTYRFRTSKLDHPKDPIPLIGSYLRDSGLDQLPRIISVLKGDMTLFGTCRPVCAAPRAMPAMQQRPGLLCTCLCGIACDKVAPEACLHLNRDYMENGSIWRDLRMLGVFFKKALVPHYGHRLCHNVTSRSWKKRSGKESCNIK